MGCVEQAVLEFDEEVQAPWRPLLVSVPALTDPSSAPAPESSSPMARRQPNRRSPSRVGACRPTAPAVSRPEPMRASGGRGAAGRPRSARVRLTRRARRLVFVLALFGAVVLGSVLGSLLSRGGGEALHLAGVSSVDVEPGDTLWSIAESVAEGDDVRAVVHRIQELNGLEGSGLVPGQVLHLP